MYSGQHRETARILLYRLNSQSQLEVFLLLTHFDPEVGLPPRWITPGGGIESGESIEAAAVRELFEETGLQASMVDLGQMIWKTEGSWLWGDGLNQHTYVDYFFGYRVRDFELDSSGWTEDEHRDVVQHRWWSIAELRDSRESVGPPGLVEFLLRHRFD